MLFENKKSLVVELPEVVTTLEGLIAHLKKNYLTEKEEMFIQGNSVRPGIIVLVNDTDWELLETTNYVIQENDSIAFISTLHGG